MNICICDLLRDLLIGLVSGGLSSWAVSAYLGKKQKEETERQKAVEKKQAQKVAFDRDKQMFHRYLLQVRTELFLAYKNGDYDFLTRTLEDEPIRETFENLGEKEQTTMREIANLFQKLKQLANEKDAISQNDYDKCAKELLKYSIDILRFKESFEEG